MKRLFCISRVIGLLFFVSSSVQAIDAIYVGGIAGLVALSGPPTAVPYNNALGFGVDVAVRNSTLFDLTGHFQASSHSGGAGGLTVYGGYVSADVHILQTSDFDFTLGVGPGFYFFNTPSASETDFGINAGGAFDVLVDEHLVVGLGVRYNAVFNGPMGGSFTNLNARLGYLFTL